jgi:acyl-CoA dehydrogenase
MLPSPPSPAPPRLGAERASTLADPRPDVTMDFSLPEELAVLKQRTREFIDGVVIPRFEPRDVKNGHGPDDSLRRELHEAGRQASLFAPHMDRELGGLGLDMRGQAIVFDEAGRSLLGPLALNCAAPDEGNMAMLEKIASSAQRERYLRPLVAGQVRSCFAMTERAPGAGSDPSMLLTEARRLRDGWRIDGEKWFITGGAGASFAIVMARTGPGAATMFLVDSQTPGMFVEESLDTIDRISSGGHARITFDNCIVDEECVLGAVGEGFRYAQVRLAPARLTHCMRWIGLAGRALDIAIDRSARRELFGSRLADLGMAQRLIADSVIDLETSRTLILRIAWLLDTAQEAALASSVAKTHCSEAAFRVIDSAIQLCGSDGITAAPLGRFLAEVRPFRIYDGSNETHRWSIARRVVRARARMVGDA